MSSAISIKARRRGLHNAHWPYPVDLTVACGVDKYFSASTSTFQLQVLLSVDKYFSASITSSASTSTSQRRLNTSALPYPVNTILRVQRRHNQDQCQHRRVQLHLRVQLIFESSLTSSPAYLRVQHHLRVQLHQFSIIFESSIIDSASSSILCRMHPDPKIQRHHR